MSHEEPWSRWRAVVYSLFNRNPMTNRRISFLVPLASSDRALDIGCGPGAAVRAAASLVDKASGVDASPKMTEIARARSAGISNVTFATGTAEALPFDDDSFSVAWSIQSWHHWNDADAGLREAARVLAPGGHLYIIERSTRGAHGLDDERAAQLVDSFGRAGFEGAIATKNGKNHIVSGTTPALSD